MHGPSAQNMQVKVVHALSTVGTRIDHDPVTIPQTFQPSHFCRCKQKKSEQRRIALPGLGKGGNMPLRNDEHMSRSLRRQVAKGQHLFVLVKSRRRNRAGGNLAKQAIRTLRRTHGTHHTRPPPCPTRITLYLCVHL